MLVRVHGSTLHGVEGVLVGVEVDAGRGLPSFQIVGYGDRIVKESRDRIRAAFRQTGVEFPKGRVTVNLTPPDIPKTGPGLDLAIAVGIAATQSALPAETLQRILMIGGLGLDGRLHPVRGALALVAAGRNQGIQSAITPMQNLNEASHCPAIKALGAHTLGEVLDHLHERATLTIARPKPFAASKPTSDLTEIRGQESAKRALEIAAAGRHNMVFVGPPGSGKTLLARHLPEILPDLDFDAALESTRIHSIVGQLPENGLLTRPPFRSPHHTISDAGMIGGGQPLRPGEISMAHRGVLFLDELPEFRRSVLEALRQPVESGCVHVVRAHGAFQLPANFQLIAAMNPCPCGHWGDSLEDCRCDDAQIRRYRTKLSGPLLDRIDLHVAVPRVQPDAFSLSGQNENTRSVNGERILGARARQETRLRDTPYRTNAELPLNRMVELCAIDASAAALLERAVARFKLTMRGYLRVLRVARSVADLDDRDLVSAENVAEALRYRFGAKPE